MTSFPIWKVRRELNRIGASAVQFASRRTYEPLRKRLYDLTSSRRQRITSGDLPLTERVAVFVTYQPNGLLPSTYVTLEHLRQSGFSVLFVSNGRLSPMDLQALSRHCAFVLERPNIGYDFGGYRDGLRHLWALRHDLALLVLMNDSTWFPLCREDDSLSRMEALRADLAGHIFKTENPAKPEDDHIEAHLMMISQEFLRSADFTSFWTNYCMSDHRTTTIRYGEKAFSQMAMASGRKVAALLDREWLLAQLDQLDDEQLLAVLNHTLDGFSRGKRDATHVRQAASRGDPWRQDFLAWVDVSLRNSRAYLLSAAFIMPALLYGRIGFVKKARDLRFHLARIELLELDAARMISPLDDVVRAEIVASVGAWKLQNGHDPVPPTSKRSPMAAN